MKIGFAIALFVGVTASQVLDDYFDTFCPRCGPYARSYGRLMDHRSFYQPEDWRDENRLDKEYDFVVVGSGSAGSVIASRLSEVPNWEVLLLEVGKGENIVSRIPAVAPMMQLSHYNWDYRMERQNNFARGMEDGLLAWPRGRALGGSTIINYMIYTRGNPRDFDNWARAGNPGWSYAEVLPYFLKSERANLKRGNGRYHNASGLWGVENNYLSELTRAFIAGGAELGSPEVDYTSADQMGYSRIQGNLLRGRRHSVARAFLHPFKKRRNLHILTSALVTRILIDPESKRAYGVEYEWRGMKRRVGVRKEVILSAGALVSPQLLMLTGVGPRDHLQSLGIPVIADLPVGLNLHDHITYVGLTFLVNRDAGTSLQKWLNPLRISSYLKNGTGPLTSLGGVSGIAYIKTSEDTNPDPTFPDMELIFADSSLVSDLGISAKSMNIRDDLYAKYFSPIGGQASWTILPMLLHPKSRGYLRLSSRNIKDPPKFYGNYFSDAENKDQRTLLAAIRYIIKLSQTGPFRKYGTTLYDAKVPGCEQYVYNSDEYWFCALETLSITLHHQVGTCRMGPDGVVDHELRVRGVDRLRVADTSVIPFAITAHTSAPAVMVGEKAADLIKHTWGQ